MLSARSHSHLFVDKENTTHLQHAQTTSRKGGASYTSAQASAYFAAKTPAPATTKGGNGGGLKHGNGKGVGMSAIKAAGSFTVGMEPGARVLGAKDGNHNKRGQPAGNKEKGKQKAGEVTTSGYNESDHALLPAKTPARPTLLSKSTAFKTPGPRFVLQDAGPSQSQHPDLSLYKTPSPNQLNRRRKGINPTPVPLDLGKPTSLLRSDSITEELGNAQPPTLQELLQIELDKIDEEQEVETAGIRLLEADLPYQPEFDVPNYSKLDLSLACFFPGRLALASAGPVDLTPSLDNEDDRAIIPDEADDPVIPQKDECDIAEPPLFPVMIKQADAARAGNGARNSRPPPTRPSSSSLSSSTSRSGVLASRSHLASSTQPRPTGSLTGPARRPFSSSSPSSKLAAPPSRVQSSSVAIPKLGMTKPGAANLRGPGPKSKPTAGPVFKLEPLEFNL